MSDFDIILDSSRQNLQEVPIKILHMTNLRMLYLQENIINTLPKDFFLKLPQLCWLDLRNNLLTTIPESIAHHQSLENLLLSNNKIEVLPNELGLVPRLKVLQIANNPLTYPSSRIIGQGTRSVCDYLRTQYEKIIQPPTDQGDMTYEDDQEMRDEEEVAVVEDFAYAYPLKDSINSSLIIKRLSKEKKDDNIVHEMSNDPSRICIKSYFPPEDKYARASTQTSSHDVSKASLRQNWMNKLTQLLEEQEKILQQERNLQALNAWRLSRKTEPVRQVSDEAIPEPPYGTDPEYDSILSRADLSKQIDRLIERNRNPPRKDDVEKLIGDLVGQLKDMETTYGGMKSPRSEIEEAGKQIMKIMDVHKKLLKLQEDNGSILQ